VNEKAKPQDDEDPAPTRHSDAQRVAGSSEGEGRPDRNDDAPGANREEGSPAG
jgi:hypothetical protein